MRRLGACVGVALLLEGTSAQSAPLYAVTDLGTLGGDFTAAYGINDSGQVVGLSTTGGGSSHAFVTGANGLGMVDLGGFKALAINSAGRVIFGDDPGTIYITGPNGIGVAPLGATDTDALGFRGSFAFGFGTVNTSGQVAGTRDAGGNVLANGPDIHGATNNGPVGSHAYVTGPNGVGLTDLGTQGGSNSFARGINDAGQVVGGSNLANTVWNDLDAPFTVRRATLWSDGGVFDLTALLDPNGPFMLSIATLTLDTAFGINNHGQIVADGFGTMTDGSFFNRAFLLTREDAAQIPETGPLALLAVGIIGMAGFPRRLARA